MNKTGASHIDWAISMGIFLVYILSMFMLIQPGIQPFYNEENLVSVIEGKLKLDLNYDISRAPIYLDVTKTCNLGQYIDTELISLGLKLDKSDLKLVYLDLRDGREVDSPFSLSGSPGNYHIQFNCPHPLYIKDNPHVFVIYYSAGGSYESAEAKTDARINKLFTAKTVTPGTIEHLTGVNENELQNLASINCFDLEGYESLKEEWAFPAEREFALYYVEADKIPYDMNDAIPLCNSGVNSDVPPFVSPFDQSNVYVKEWGDWILTPDGTMKPIIYNLRIW